MVYPEIASNKIPRAMTKIGQLGTLIKDRAPISDEADSLTPSPLAVQVGLDRAKAADLTFHD